MSVTPERREQLRAQLLRARGKPRTQWKNDEMDLVAQAAAVRLIASGIGEVPGTKDRVGSTMLVAALRAAQDVLPPERRKMRVPLNRNVFGGARFFRRLAAVLKRELTKGHPEPAAEGELSAQPPAAAAPSPPPAEPAPDPRDALAGVDFTPAGPTVFAEQLPTSELAAALVGRLFELLEARSGPREVEALNKAQAELQQMQSVLFDEMEAIKRNVRTLHDAMGKVTAAIPELEAERKRPLRVALIGMRKDQFDFITEKLAGLPVELRHYDVNTRPANIRADYACAMRFLWHSWAEKAKACVAPGHFAFLRGGGQQVAEQIRSWLGQTGRLDQT